MGYMTRFTSDTWPRMDDREFEALWLRHVEDCPITPTAEAKWYGHESDMRQLSADRPDVAFILWGYGEDMGDYWRKIFKNGELVEHVKATFPPSQHFREV